MNSAMRRHCLGPDQRDQPGHRADGDAGEQRAEQIAQPAKDDHREDDAEPLVCGGGLDEVAKAEDHAGDRGARSRQAAQQPAEAAMVDPEGRRDGAVLGEGAHATTDEGAAQHKMTATKDHQREPERDDPAVRQRQRPDVQRLDHVRVLRPWHLAVVGGPYVRRHLDHDDEQPEAH